eukprot:TRINITY_DN27926_c0_g1_i2.p1 TRINITY_DN27926_c0_g1~~TRINITY_DN27926_c0_g1_i2.p1  ORF type:complete len:158 (-),score=25.37 TRINITY_DN27926_c0_g1_i2:507-980(-)
MILELRNMISGEVTTVDFEFPGNVWQLKCRVARLCSDVPLDGASEGVQLWKVATPGDNGEAGGSRLLTDEYEEIESPQFQQPQSKQLQSSDTFSTPSLSFGYLLKRRATFNETSYFRRGGGPMEFPLLAGDHCRRKHVGHQVVRRFCEGCLQVHALV